MIATNGMRSPSSFDNSITVMMVPSARTGAVLPMHFPRLPRAVVPLGTPEFDAQGFLEPEKEQDCPGNLEGCEILRPRIEKIAVLNKMSA